MKLHSFALLTGAIVTLGAATQAAAPVPPEVTLQPEPVVEVETEKRWVLPRGSKIETIVLDALQERGITDKNALATILGNIKQESKFHPNICEGGHRVQYQHCNSGGYGLIQWTTVDRYNGLGHHARTLGHDPSTVEAQVSYLFTERQWKGIEPSLMRPGQSIQYYMQKAYRWLGWGHHGRRTQYAWEYFHSLTIKQVPAK